MPKKSHVQDALETLRDKFTKGHEFRFMPFNRTEAKPEQGYVKCSCGWSGHVIEGTGDEANRVFAEHVSNYNRERHMAEVALEAIKGL